MNNGKILISLKDITRIYEIGSERICALDGVTVEIGENEYVAVMGQSGSGKSTLMNLIGCLDRATDGTYELDGRNTTAMSNSFQTKLAFTMATVTRAGIVSGTST